MDVNFATPIFYFKPYPGTKITNDVLEEGFELPKTIQEWSDFDYVSSSGPLVSDEKHDFFEKFKFYLKFAYSNQKIIYKPLQLLARIRCKYKFFRLPLEKTLANKFFKKQQLT